MRQEKTRETLFDTVHQKKITKKSQEYRLV